MPVRAADRVARAAQERAERGAGEQQQPDRERRHPDDRRAGRAEQRREEAIELAADPAAVRAEGEHQAEGADGEAGAERAHVDERAAGDHQGAEADERDREHVAGVADHRGDRVADRAADDPAVPAEVEQRAEEDPERDERRGPRARCGGRERARTSPASASGSGRETSGVAWSCAFCAPYGEVRGAARPSSLAERGDALDQELDEAGRVDPGRDVAVRRLAHPLPEIDERAAARELPGAVDRRPGGASSRAGPAAPRARPRRRRGSASPPTRTARDGSARRS